MDGEEIRRLVRGSVSSRLLRLLCSVFVCIIVRLCVSFETLKQEKRTKIEQFQRLIDRNQFLRLNRLLALVERSTIRKQIVDLVRIIALLVALEL